MGKYISTESYDLLQRFRNGGAEPEPEAAPEPEQEADLKEEAAAESAPGTGSEPAPELETQPNPDPKSAQKPDPEPAPKPAPEPEPEPDPVEQFLELEDTIRKELDEGRYPLLLDIIYEKYESADGLERWYDLLMRQLDDQEVRAKDVEAAFLNEQDWLSAEEARESDGYRILKSRVTVSPSFHPEALAQDQADLQIAVHSVEQAEARVRELERKIRNLKVQSETLSKSNRDRKAAQETMAKNWEQKTRRELEERFSRELTEKRELIEKEAEEKRAALEEELDEAFKEGQKKNKEKVAEDYKARREKLNEELKQDKKKAKEDIRAERKKLISLIRKDPLSAERAAAAKEREAAYERQVAEMVRGRQKMKDEIIEEMHSVSRSFREGSLGAIETLKQQTAQLLETIQTETDNAINQVVSAEQRFNKDNFEDLLREYQKLEEQVYRRRLAAGEKSKEYQTYWKRVDLFLRGFQRTLSKLGYVRYIPAEGDPFRWETMEVEPEETAGEETAPAIPEEESVVAEVLCSGFMRDGHPEQKALVKVRRRTILDEPAGN